MQQHERDRRAADRRHVLQRFRHRIQVCAGLSCPGNEAIISGLRRCLKEHQLENQVLVRKVGCMGLCAMGPIVQIEPGNIFYQHVQPDDAMAIIEHLDREPVQRLLISGDLPFFTKQHKQVLVLSGRIDPENIDDYLAAGGYTALIHAVTSRNPSDIIEDIRQSGLRGRGGAGFPTGLKWSSVAQASSDRKYVVCNADEGDPGAFMDRAILESSPHSVLEGMMIAAYAIQAHEGFIYVHAEYPLAVKRMQQAIHQAERDGFLGRSICGTDFHFTLNIRLGAGAYVCGEETALIASIEGRRGTPRPKPPYPAARGLWDHPTLINNVETFANIPAILEHGSAWFASLGTENSKGTKVFSLTGKVRHTGLIEVPMGTSLRDIVFAIGGGVPDGHTLKAVQTGGPSGGCIPAELIDTPVSYEDLQAVGSIMGSGGMIVIDNTSSMIDIAQYFITFSMEESCGKCVPCRVGTAQIHHLLTKFQKGTATMNDLRQLEELCEIVSQTSLCGLGQAAPNPVRSTLRYFRQEYLDRIASSPAAQQDTHERT
jgi:bidirectional [NiFe] hydrogenase diaphorase subunit